MGAIDYWCNAFEPAYRALWDAAIGEQGLSVRVRRDPEDSFAEPAAFLARMDELGFDTVLLPSAEVPRDAGPYAYERYATPPEQVAKLAAAHPGRFAGLWTIDPADGPCGRTARRRGARAAASSSACHLHTHSWDRAFDHRDLYPFYALAAEHDVPVVMQAGASGGLLPSECGRPIGIDRPAIYFGAVRFVLSHTGWPWTGEAIAMAHKHSNVYLGTAAWPPHRWPAELVDFIARSRAGQDAARHRLPSDRPPPGARDSSRRSRSPTPRAPSCCGGAARRVFTRIPGSGGLSHARTRGADGVPFEKIDWDDPTSALDPNDPGTRELARAARASGARRKKIVSGEGGFFMNRSVMPANFRVPAHHHDHDELLVVLAGGCSFDDGLAELGAGRLDRDPRRTPTTASRAAATEWIS